MVNCIGWVTVTAWNSKVEGVKLGSLKREKLHLGESRRPVPPPLPEGLGVWEKEYAVERAAGVDVLDGVIQVSVRARKSRDCREA